ncbi:alpha-tocopherol transfer protein-like protein [Trichonephila clavata]|uniref:Alpha-tocopherol transfer protein-like protein n=1 Tax=Trichonephila clavata TaxID=2740835 RepID=A0A8X6H7W8_TRICU|nr:alpha-tocopherol transfer protein-like protein [Trichonephila clavata]
MKYLSTYEQGLSPELEQKAKDELGETPEKKTQSLKELRILINEEADFRPQNDDEFLTRFLRVKKYDVKKAFTTLRNFYIFKARYSRLLTDFKPSEVLPILEMNNLFVMPYRHPSGATVCYMRPAYYDIDKVTIDEICATAFVALEYYIRYDACQVGGFIVIFDENKLSFRIMKHYADLRFLYRCVRFIQDCVPGRIQAIHFWNQPFYFGFILNIFKALVSDKISKRIHCHGANHKSLHQHVPADILPEELGGNLGPLAPLANDFRNKIMSIEASIEKMNTYGFSEKKIKHFKRQDSKSAFL